MYAGSFVSWDARQSAHCVLKLGHEDPHHFICMFIAPVWLPDHQHK